MSEDFPILAAVAASPAHSFQVLEHLQSIGLPASRSTLYRRVEALIAAGYLEAEESRGPRGHVRRDLHLTDAGHERIAREARDVLADAPLESPAFALAIGCARMLDRDALPDVLRPRMARAAQQLTQEERALRAVREDWSAIAGERRVAHLQADISWLQSVLARRIVGKTAGVDAENAAERGAA
jgi:DNA-binding MarR family transcriptional regulator